MTKKTKRSEWEKVNKKCFIEFLASATPEEINQVILERGKPRKAFSPVIFHDDRYKKQGGK